MLKRWNSWGLEGKLDLHAMVPEVTFILSSPVSSTCTIYKISGLGNSVHWCVAYFHTFYCKINRLTWLPLTRILLWQNRDWGIITFPIQRHTRVVSYPDECICIPPASPVFRAECGQEKEGCLDTRQEDRQQLAAAMESSNPHGLPIPPWTQAGVQTHPCTHTSQQNFCQQEALPQGISSVRWRNSWYILLGRLCSVLMVTKTCEHMRTIFCMVWQNLFVLKFKYASPICRQRIVQTAACLLPRISLHSGQTSSIAVHHFKHLPQLHQSELRGCPQSHT